MTDVFGASQEAWHHWSVALGLTAQLLPVVANPDAKISPDSKMQALGKTPSRYNFRGEATGIAKWTSLQTTHREVERWSLEPDLGICVQARAVRAIDIDVPGLKRSRKIVEAIEDALPLHNWSIRRTRAATGKLLLPFLYEGELPKAVLPVGGDGMIEILGDGQQWIAESSYIRAGKVDGRYLWPAGWPKRQSDLPVLDDKDLATLMEVLELFEGSGPWKQGRVKRDQPLVPGGSMPGGDPVAEWIDANWDVRDYGSGGVLYIACPWIDEHSGDSGPSETQYMPAGTGGYERGHFKCLHAHCLERTDSEYLEAMGWSPDMSDAPLVPAEPEPGTGKEIERVEPRYQITKQGEKKRTAYNHELFLRDAAASGMYIAWDSFTAQLVWRAERSNSLSWQRFEDHHYQRLVRAMDRYGFVQQSAEGIRSAVHSYGVEHHVDTLRDWVEALPKWDGFERVETFWHVYGKAEDNAFTRAVGRYVWTAQAGRALDPGCQVDMVPILVGLQGARKTSLVRAIAPNISHFGEIDLTEKDDDTTRKMRGKAVIELGELRGMRGREKESTKAFVTRIVEEWVPKYKEFPSTFFRRFVMYGTTNEDAFLADSTGERRWLPFEVGLGGEVLDIEGAERDREQLWAEAVHRWRENGIEWQDAERLARAEHDKFKEVDPWTPCITRWLLTGGALDNPELAPVDMPHKWTLTDVCVGALGLKVGQINGQVKRRVAEALAALGCTHKRVRGLHGQGWTGRRSKIEAFLKEKDDGSEADPLFN